MKAKSVRDEFAMAALLALASGHMNPGQRERTELARIAYAMADEMLAARELDPRQLKDLVRG